MGIRSLGLKRAALLTAVLLWPGVVASAGAANLFAVVNQAGVLQSGGGVSNVVHLGFGQYEVTFTSDVSQCAYMATTANVTSQAFQAFTAGGHLSVNGVYVETKNQGGGLSDVPFHLVVVCNVAKMKYAVVDYSGNLTRATPGTTLTNLGAGRYTITFTQSVSACAFIATVADPGNGLVYAPAGVYTASGTTANAVYIETKNGGGGLQTGVPFHLGVICGPTNTRIAVVNNTGLIKRGSALTSTYQWTTGEYTAVTTQILNPGCAVVATRGSVDKAVPFAPATVEVVAGPASNTAGVQVRNLLGLNGQKVSAAFHMAMVCK